MSHQVQADTSTDRIIHLHLEGILSDGLVLAVHLDLRFVALLESRGQHPQMRAAQFFAPLEMATLVPLVLSHPDYCPNEYLLASFSGGSTEKDIERARIRLLGAKECGEWDLFMRPLRNYLSRIRIKLNTLQIDVRSIFETGYLLRPYTQGQFRRLRRV